MERGEFMNTVTLNSMAFDNFEVTNAKFLSESVGGVNEVVAGSACAMALGFVGTAILAGSGPVGWATLALAYACDGVAIAALNDK